MLDFRVGKILRRRGSLESWTNEEIAREAKAIRGEAIRGKPLSRLMIDTFALASEVTRRKLGKSHYPVQIHAGIKLFQGSIAEMQTGEGKTITAILPAALRAFAGLGCHVMTANEYLSGRDASHLRSVYESLGLSIGVVQTEHDDATRKMAYSSDITYSTAAEIGFDFLRDSMKTGNKDGNSSRAQPAERVHRGFHFALVDEADSILIDEARTPLIIGTEKPDERNRMQLCSWACEFSKRLVLNEDFLANPKKKEVDLTEFGCRKVLGSALPMDLTGFNNEEIFQHLEQSLIAKYFYQRERDYIVVDDGAVVIVDEGSGRIMEERKWQQGLHQAIEAKENVTLTPANATAARITLQTLFRKYEYLSGMTGTIQQAKYEIRSVYKTHTCVVPTNRPCRRHGLPTRVFIDLRSKLEAIVVSVRSMLENGRSVLIGTPSVAASESVSLFLKEAGIQHEVLNCRSHGREAEIVSCAGRLGAVTIATNMAGRGTDILLDEDVRVAGGLHIIATERHTSSRIDRQLVGRSARQGDPGSFQFLLSLEDELFRAMKVERHEKILRVAKRSCDSSGELPATTEQVFRKHQSTIEKLHARNRKQLLKQEKQRLKSFLQMSLDPCIELVED